MAGRVAPRLYAYDPDEVRSAVADYEERNKPWQQLPLFADPSPRLA